MRSILAGLRRLVIPWGAAPGTPRIVIGPDVPAELAAYYVAPFDMAAAIIYYSDITNAYYYEGVLQSAAIVRGWYVGGFGGGVIESHRTFFAGADSVSEYFGESGSTKDIGVVFNGTGRVSVQVDQGLFVSGDLLVNGVGAFRAARHSSEYTNNTTGFVADPQLTITIPTAGAYLLTGWIAVSSPAASDFKLRLTRSFAGEIRWQGTGSALLFDSATYTVLTTGGFDMFQVQGMVSANAAGTVGCEWGQVAAAGGPTYVLTGSWLRLDRMA